MHILNILSLLIKRSIECMICILDWKPKYGFHRCWEACNPQNNSLNGCKCNTNMILKTKIFFIRTILQTKRMLSKKRTRIRKSIPFWHTWSCVLLIGSHVKSRTMKCLRILPFTYWIGARFYIQLVHFFTMKGCKERKS